MAQRLATVAGIIGFLICLATAFVLAPGDIVSGTATFERRPATVVIILYITVTCACVVVTPTSAP